MLSLQFSAAPGTTHLPRRGGRRAPVSRAERKMQEKEAGNSYLPTLNHFQDGKAKPTSRPTGDEGLCRTGSARFISRTPKPLHRDSNASVQASSPPGALLYGREKCRETC